MTAQKYVYAFHSSKTNWETIETFKELCGAIQVLD
jgi:tRNA(Glu) U13 pseudouridine synthase TruD